MTVYKYLGYGVTNENGIAKLDHDADGQEISHSYVGVGAGEIDYIASLDNPIVDGSIVSEILNVWDTWKYDNATTSSHKDIWGKYNGTEGFTRGDTYSTLDEGTGSSARLNTLMPDGEWEADITIRADGGTSEWVIGLYENNDGVTGVSLGVTDTWVDLHMKYDGEHLYCYKDGSSTPYITRDITFDTGKILMLSLQTPSNVTTVDFKDFKVYNNETFIPSFKDVGTTADHNDDWAYPSSKVSASRTNTGTLLTMGTGQTWGQAYVKSNSYKFSLPICLEFDVVSVEDSPKLRLYGDSTSTVISLSQLGHYKIKFTDNGCPILINSGIPTTYSWIDDLAKTNGLGMAFELDADTDKLTYKNFVINPLE